MSVWESTTYKLTLARQIYTQIPFMYREILGRTCSPYLAPKGDLCPIEPTCTWEEVAQICDWDRDSVNPDCKRRILRMTREVEYWAIGMEGVYQLIGMCHKGKFEVSGQYDYALIERRLDALMTVLCASTLVTPKEFKSKWGRASEIYVEEGRKFERFAEGWKYFTRCIDPNVKEFKRVDQERYFGDGDRCYFGGRIKDLIILVGSAKYRCKGIIFSRRHLDFLIGASLRIANLLDYTAREYYMEPKVQRAIIKMLHMTIADSFKSKKHNADKVVQAYHKARSFMQMRLFENEMKDALTTALKEFQAKQLQSIVNLNQYRACFKDIPRGKWLDLFHVYKWMPPPDFDPTYAFTELYEYHMNTRQSGLDSESSTQMKELWKRVVRERKLNVAIAYQKVYSSWPPSFKIAGSNPTSKELDDWEPKKLFPYFTYGADVSAQIKDKSTVTAELRDEMLGLGDNKQRSFLMWYMQNKDHIDTVVAGDRLRVGGLPEDNYARVAYKGEAHKPGSRLFFMAPPLQRILLGELEGNISRIASYYPASLQGMNSLEKVEELAKLFNVLEDVSYIGEPVTCYVVTFDLSKFSPRFNPAVLKDLHRFWADVFGYEPIVKMGTIGSEGVILHTTSNLVMSYENKGADLEGFRGRMMTLFHADLIAAACRYAKEKGYIIEKSAAAVFIDDGAVRVYAKGHGAIAKQNALAFLKCMQEVYEAAGQENHPNKTIVSGIGGELLSEVYISGLRQRCPIKASMRLHPNYDNLCNSITEEFDAMFATSQGAVKDSCDWVVAYRRLAEAYIKAICRWSRKKFRFLQPVQFAYRLVTPRGMGGFGFPTMQALVSTTAYDMTAEGLGIINASARMFPEYEATVYKILKRAVVQRDPLDILRDPSRIRYVGPVLVEGRMVRKVLDKLRRRRGPFAKHIMLAEDEDIIEHATKVAEAILARGVVSFPVLQRAWDCTPLAYLENIVQKFRRSDTIIQMLHPQEITRIRGANSHDVTVLITRFFGDE